MPEEKVKKLDRLLSLLDPDNALSKSDFIESFKKVLDLVLKMLEKQERFNQQMFSDHIRLSGERKQEYDSNFRDLKGQVNELFVGDQLKRMDSETKASFSKLQSLINSTIDQKLKQADEHVSQLKPIKGDKGDKGDVGPMPTEHLELMKEVQMELKKVKEVLSNIPRGKAMGRARVPMPRTVDLTADQNGVARTFNIPQDTVRIFGAFSSQFPFAIASGDIDRAGNQITLDDTIAPRERGQTLILFTDALFYP